MIYGKECRNPKHTRSEAMQTKSSIGCPRWFCKPEFLKLSTIISCAIEFVFFPYHLLLWVKNLVLSFWQTWLILLMNIMLIHLWNPNYLRIEQTCGHSPKAPACPPTTRVIPPRGMAHVVMTKTKTKSKTKTPSHQPISSVCQYQIWEITHMFHLGDGSHMFPCKRKILVARKSGSTPISSGAASFLIWVTLLKKKKDKTINFSSGAASSLA